MIAFVLYCWNLLELLRRVIIELLYLNLQWDLPNHIRLYPYFVFRYRIAFSPGARPEVIDCPEAPVNDVLLSFSEFYVFEGRRAELLEKFLVFFCDLLASSSDALDEGIDLSIYSCFVFAT